MKTILLKLSVPLTLLLAMSACVDNNYDLSDVDTTTKVNVNGLVIPLNVEEILLSDVIKIDQDDPDNKIKIMDYEGQKIYAVSQIGDIESDQINVDGFTAQKPQVTDASMSFNLLGTRAVTVRNTYEFNNSTPQDINFRAENVDESIISIDNIRINPMNITMHVVTTGLDDNTSMEFPRIEINFIKGLTLLTVPEGYSYDSESGLLTVSNISCPGHDFTISVDAVAVNLREAGVDLNTTDRTIDFNSVVNIKDADLITVTTTDNPASAPRIVDFNIHTEVNDIVATAFTGIIEYTLKGDKLNIDPVDLSDVPDFLSQDGTNIILKNPQIYINLNNPMAVSSNHLPLSSGLVMEAVRGTDRKSFELDPNQEINVPGNEGEGPFNFVLSPSRPGSPLPEYSPITQYVGYSSLSNILSGNKIPELIDIKLVSPGIPVHRVTDFRLYTDYGYVHGNYEFFAPLSLVPQSDTEPVGTTIIYRKDDTDWNDETVDKITIENMEISLNASSNVPLDATMRVYPLDINGDVMPVNIEPAILAANTPNQALKITVTGEIKNLNGLRFEAVVHPGSEETLSPDQSISVSDVKAKVTGYYETDF